jgi:GNAT superfamily N-acetyltransferase
MHVDLPDDRPRLILSLPDGSEAVLSPLGVDDRWIIEEGFEELSTESRFTRFGQGLGHLSASELTYLSDVDQRSHVAWGLVVDGDGVGIGRYIVMPAAGCAEVALTVIDEWQGRGVGTLLMRVLAAVARADGVAEFCFEFLPENHHVRQMLAAFDIPLVESGSLVEGRIPVSEFPVEDWGDEAVGVLDQARS